MKLNNKTFEDSFKKLKKMKENKDKFARKKDIQFTPFKMKNFDKKIAVVDGSNNTIEGVGFEIALMRAGAIFYENGERRKDLDNVDEVSVFTLSKDKKGSSGFLGTYNNVFFNIVGEIPSQRIEFDKIHDRMRTLLEWNKINQLLDVLDEEDIVIFDGSLVSGLINTSDTFFENIIEKAKKKKIVLVGLTKDTNLLDEGVPIPTILKESARLQDVKTNWYAEWQLEEAIEQLEKTYFVKFTKRKEFIFRIDMVIPENKDVEQVLAAIGSYCFSDGSLGYPYPLNEIHESVLISKNDKEEVFRDLKLKWIKEMKNEKDFEELFFNFHKDQLDILAIGR